MEKLSLCGPEVLEQMGLGSSLEELIAMQDAMCSQGEGCDPGGINQCFEAPTPCR